MKIDIADIIGVFRDAANALEAYDHIMKLPNCNGCARGLDICPKAGENLRINCSAFWDITKGERPGLKSDDETTVDIQANVEDSDVNQMLETIKDSELLKYLKGDKEGE